MMARELADAAALAVAAAPLNEDLLPAVVADLPPHPPPHSTLAPLRMGTATNRGSRPYQVKRRGSCFKERKEKDRGTSFGRK